MLRRLIETWFLIFRSMQHRYQDKIELNSNTNPKLKQSRHPQLYYVFSAG